MPRSDQPGPVALPLGAPCASLLPPQSMVPCGPYVPALPSPTLWTPPAVDVAALLAAQDGPARLAAAIKAAPEGVLVLSDALPAPFAAIGDLFDRVTPERGARANAAYCAGSSRLVWKDAFGEGRGGPHVDYKRVIDLSPHRMESLSKAPPGLQAQRNTYKFEMHPRSADPALASELGAPLDEALRFFGAARNAYGPLLVEALRLATGYEFTEAEARFAFRLVDYGARELQGAGAPAAAPPPPPRCGAHRDFGPATIIWPGGEGSDGLEVRVGRAWRRLPRLPRGSAVLLFGLCTAWRSNDRIPAAEHRVADDPALLMPGAEGAGGVSPRRLSAVLFMGLCDSSMLAPALAGEGEVPHYRAMRVGDVQPTVRRKWSWREGSVTQAEAAAEEEERARFDSQEALIAALYKL